MANLYPVTKKTNSDFSGFATAEQIAANPNLVIIGKDHIAQKKVEEAAKAQAEKAANDAILDAVKPSEAIKPSDVKRKPAAQ